MPNQDEKAIVRDARPEDAEAAGRIAVAAWKPIYAEYANLLGAELYAKLGDLEKSKYDTVVDFIRKTPGDAVVAEVAGKVVGFSTLVLHSSSYGPKIGELRANAVDAAFAGRGIGQKMAEASIAKLLARGAEALEVSTGMDPGHAPARRLYEKLGFKHSLHIVTYFMLASDCKR
jgi:GNAT superfamily N-acetyltransferase